MRRGARPECRPDPPAGRSSPCHRQRGRADPRSCELLSARARCVRGRGRDLGLRAAAATGARPGRADAAQPSASRMRQEPTSPPRLPRWRRGSCPHADAAQDAAWPPPGRSSPFAAPSHRAEPRLSKCWVRCFAGAYKSHKHEQMAI
ncbi:hypothetical protein BOSE127_110461 [Bosea sp. 127]|nr:hypothetical protein BOSE127_110461 [Bosea sp. 127]